MKKKTTEQLINHFSTFVTPERFEKIKQLVTQRTRLVTIALEEPHKTQNTGAIVRSCDAFGVQDMHAITGRNQLAVKNAIASGATKWLSVYQYQTSAQCMQNLKQKGYQLVATSPHATTTLQEIPVDKPIALFFGTEKEGLSQEILSAVDSTVKIPMFGFTESFNVSVSVALCLYQITTMLRSSDINWQLSEREQEQLILDWLKASVERPDLIEQLIHQ